MSRETSTNIFWDMWICWGDFWCGTCWSTNKRPAASHGCIVKNPEKITHSPAFNVRYVYTSANLRAGYWCCLNITCRAVLLCRIPWRRTVWPLWFGMPVTFGYCKPNLNLLIHPILKSTGFPDNVRNGSHNLNRHKHGCTMSIIPWLVGSLFWHPIKE